MSDAARAAHAERMRLKRRRDRAAGILYPLSRYAWCCLEDVAAFREIPAGRVHGLTRNRRLGVLKLKEPHP